MKIGFVVVASLFMFFFFSSSLLLSLSLSAVVVLCALSKSWPPGEISSGANRPQGVERLSYRSTSVNKHTRSTAAKSKQAKASACF